MSNLYNNIKSLCAQNNTNITQMCKTLGIARSALSELCAGRTRDLSSDNKKKIATYFEVDVEYLDHEFHEMPCPLCGLSYVPSEKGEIAIHEAQHEKWRIAVKHFGFCWSMSYRENAKTRARNLLEDTTIILTENQQIKCCKTIFKSLFSRSLESYNFSPKHVDFETYSAMLLNQGKRQRLIFGDLSDEKYEKLYNKLVDKFGKKEGMPDGTYYPYERFHHIENDESHKTIKKKNNDVTNEVKLIARKTKDLPEEDREALLNLLNSTVDTFLKAKGIKND